MDVKALRRKLNLTQEELAEKAFTTPRTIQRWENHDVHPNLQGRQRLREIGQEFTRRQALNDGPTKRQLEATGLEVDDGRIEV